MGSICLLSDGGLPSVSCVTHYSFVRLFVFLACAILRGVGRVSAGHPSARAVNLVPPRAGPPRAPEPVKNPGLPQRPLRRNAGASREENGLI